MLKWASRELRGKGILTKAGKNLKEKQREGIVRGFENGATSFESLAKKKILSKWEILKSVLKNHYF